MRLPPRALALGAALCVPAGALPRAAADDICVWVSTAGTVTGPRTLGHCEPYSFGVHCRGVDGGLDPSVHGYVVVCVPR